MDDYVKSVICAVANAVTVLYGKRPEDMSPNEYEFSIEYCPLLQDMLLEQLVYYSNIELQEYILKQYGLEQLQKELEWRDLKKRKLEKELDIHR